METDLLIKPLTLHFTALSDNHIESSTDEVNRETLELGDACDRLDAITMNTEPERAPNIVDRISFKESKENEDERDPNCDAADTTIDS